MRLALVIGNSRLHWGVVSPRGAIATWDTAYWDEDALRSVTDTSSILQLLGERAKHATRICPVGNGQDMLTSEAISPVLWLASVVPDQTQLWRQILPNRVITLDQIPLHNLYATLGIDRALALLGAGEKFGFPTLVIDGGTALTFSGVNNDRHFVGGAIAPGLRLQGRSLAQHTAALSPLEVSTSQGFEVPERWATQTSSAIQSGIVYMLLAGIEDFVWNWWQMHPSSAVVFTGGDGEFFCRQLQQRLEPSLKTMDLANHPLDRVHFCSSLVFEGICTLL